MAFYGDKDKASKLADVSVGFVTDEMQEVINEWINANIKSSGFVESDEIEEYYDIKKYGQNELILKNFPVTELIEIINGFGDSQLETLVLNTDYVVDDDTGIIQLLGYKKFIKGFNSVKVKYKYGYTVVPPIIVQIATLMAAKWASIWASDIPVGEGGEVIKSVKMGDYSESYDLGFMSVKSEFDELLNPLIKRAQEYYAVGV